MDSGLHDCDMIYPGLYLGSVKALMSLCSSASDEQEQWHVVTLLSRHNMVNTPIPTRVSKHLTIEIDDVPNADIYPHFRTCHEFIINAHKDGKDVLVHCMAGISRSASIIITHLILKHHIDYHAAFAMVRHRRPIVAPNGGFRNALKALHKSLPDNKTSETEIRQEGYTSLEPFSGQKRNRNK